MNPVFILGIESSCDDTSIAVSRDSEILSNTTISQWIHIKYGGVVPEAASRLHVESIVSLTEEALQLAGITKNQLHAIAVTRGPGLIGSLLVGLSFAKALSLSLNIPLIEVNHLEAHIHSLFISNVPAFPLLCMTVSGGHTQLILLNSKNDYQILGQTLDDAAGEAFDKTGKLLGLDYPAGAQMDQLAIGDKFKFKFPIAQIPGYNFSFSGLKTAVLYFLRESIKSDPDFIKNNLPDLCASIQHTIVETLIQKLKKAAVAYKVNSIGIAGGVSANSYFRSELNNLCQLNEWTLYLPKLTYCTDNGAMIAITGYHKYLKQLFSEDNITPLARYPLISTQLK
jgi:N6-L-threonylcarbamoyladenine synthase